MSKPLVNFMKFKDDKGLLCAIRKDYCTEDEAKEIAKEQLITESVKRTNEYHYMYHGFGKTVDMDEYENTWWITESKNKSSIPVYVFREG